LLLLLLLLLLLTMSRGAAGRSDTKTAVQITLEKCDKIISTRS
jgi:hypothetical protein